jgi:hypothetical protein
MLLGFEALSYFGLQMKSSCMQCVAVLILPFFLLSCRAKVGYGVLTDVQNWYLFKRDHGGSLYISRGFKWDDRQPPLPAAIAYLLDSAVVTGGDFDFPPRTGERSWSWEATPCPSPSGGSKDDEDKDSTYKSNKNETGGNRQSPPR